MLDKKTRLNTSIRAHVVARALETSGVIREAKALTQARADLAEEIRLALIARDGYTDAGLRQEYETRASDPRDKNMEHWLAASVYTNHDDFTVNLNGQSHRIYMDGRYDAKDSSDIKIKRVYEGGPIIPRICLNLASPELLEKHTQLIERHRDNVAKREQVEATMGAVLKQFNTVGSLLAAYPDLAELLPENITATTGTALALTPKDLNNICGLPS